MVNLHTVLSQKENLHVECKLAQNKLPSSIWETYSAFANTAGGVILLGIKENNGQFTPNGVENPQQMISDIWNTLNNSQKISANILFDHHVYIQTIDDMSIVVMEVPRASRQDRPVYVDENMFHGSYRRNGEGDYRCTKEEIKAMLRDQAEISPDNTLLENLTLEVFYPESIKRYRLIFDQLKPHHIWTQLNNDEFLIKIGAARKSTIDRQLHPTLAGLIFFGEFSEITNELPNYFLDYREHQSHSTRWTDRVSSADGDWSGNIFDFYFKIIDRLLSDVKTPFALKNGLTRIDETPVHTALREALANCLIHADYFGRRGIVIDKEYNKIIFSNPGTFRMSIDEAISGGISDARNSKIFNMFTLINVGERSGTGLCDLYYIWKSNHFIKPQLTETLAPERVTLVLQAQTEQAYTLEESSYENINRFSSEGNAHNFEGNLTINEGNKHHDEVYPNIYLEVHEGNLLYNDHQNKPFKDCDTEILKLLSADPKMSAVTMAKKLGLSRATVERHLRALKENHVLRREGSTRGRWIIM